MRKYGIDKFTIEQLDTAETFEELNNKEIYYIQQYDSSNHQKGYNNCKGGGGIKDYHHSDEAKQKISAASKALIRTPEHCRKISEAQKGIANHIQTDAEKLKTCWAKLNSDHSEWTYQVKPTTAKECIGISVKHEDQCPWAYEVRDLFEKLCAADSEHYRVTRDANLVQTVEAIPEKTFEELKTEKLQALSAEASRFQAWNCKDMYIKSSLGFEINSDQCSQNNIQILIGMLPDDTATTSFKIYDNTFKALTKPQLKILLSECEQAGLALYQTKFALQGAIGAAKTKEDLDAIKIEFTMMDFSK